MKKIFLKFCLLACIPLFSVSCVYSHAVRTIVAVKLFPPSVVEVGDDMVDAKLFDINGNKKHLSDYLSDKYLLLSFWSNNCGFSKMSLPETKEVSEIYHENLTVISINLDYKTEWKKAMAEQNMSWINVRDPKSHAGLAGKYGNDLDVPYFVIISPEGKIIYKWFGYSEELIKKNVSENIKL